jgi:hypothetical protein
LAGDVGENTSVHIKLLELEGSGLGIGAATQHHLLAENGRTDKIRSGWVPAQGDVIHQLICMRLDHFSNITAPT